MVEKRLQDAECSVLNKARMNWAKDDYKKASDEAEREILRERAIRSPGLKAQVQYDQEGKMETILCPHYNGTCKVLNSSCILWYSGGGVGFT